MIKLHYHPISSYSLRVQIAAAEKGIELDLSLVNFTNKQQQSEQYKSLNPYGRVPAIEDGDFVLYESSTILHYLEDKYPNIPLMPNNIQDKALVNLHMRLCDLEFANHTGFILKQVVLLPKEQWDLEGIRDAKEKISNHLEKLAKDVNGKSFLVADQFTLADVCYSTFVPYLTTIGINTPDELLPWIKNISDRESVKSLLPKTV